MDEASSRHLEQAVIGCLLGTAGGDAVGLVCEGLPRLRVQRLFPRLDGPRLIGRRGMTSDDTEHTCLVAQALIASAGDSHGFTRQLAKRLRLWLLALPAGVGWATLRATVRLCTGFPPERSGVCSAGNGPAMRSALLGVCYGDDSERLRTLVRANTLLTHTDARAEAGALAVAVAADIAAGALAVAVAADIAAGALAVAVAADIAAEACDTTGTPERYVLALERAVGSADAGLLPLVHKAVASATRGEATTEFAASLGAARKVTGYVYQTVPVALHAWLRHPTDFRSAILGVIACGGDTDTTAAIAGAIIGAGVAKKGIPSVWLGALGEYPRTVAWMERLGAPLAVVCETNRPQQPLTLPLVPLFLRNAAFAAIVIAHGLRRLLPPY